MPRKSQKSVIRRGRKTQKSILNPKFDSSDDDEDFDEEDDSKEASREPTVPRRSTRKILAVDQYKKLSVVRPRDDVKVRFGLTAKEAHEFTLMLQSDDRYDEEVLPFASSSEAFVGEIKEVIVPNVFRKTVGGKSRTKAALHVDISPRQRDINRQGSNYMEYDLDSDDESFLQTLSKRSGKKLVAKKGKSYPELPELTSCKFEEMISLLETELENSKVKVRYNLEQEIPIILSRKFLAMGEEILKILSTEGNRSQTQEMSPKVKLSKKKPSHLKGTRIPSTGEIVKHYHQIMNVSTSLLGTLHLLLDRPDSILMNTSGTSMVLSQSLLRHMVLTIYDQCLKDFIDSSSLPSSSRSPLSSLLNGKNFTRRVFGKELIQSLLPKEQAVEILHDSFTAQKYMSERKNSQSQLLTPHHVELYEGIYDHWLEKRSLRVDSLLRSFHILSDDEWSLAILNLLTLTENNSFESFMSKHNHLALCRLRDFFDQINDLLGRVSRGKKVKKDALQRAKTELEHLLHELHEIHEKHATNAPQSHIMEKGSEDASKPEQVQKKKGRPRKYPPTEEPPRAVETKAEPITLKLRNTRFDLSAPSSTISLEPKKMEKENCDPTVGVNKRKRHDEDLSDENNQKIQKSSHAQKSSSTQPISQQRYNKTNSSLPTSPFQSGLRSAFCSLSHLGTYVYESIAGGRG